MVDSFSQVIPNSPPRQLATSTERPTKIAYTQNRTLVVLDLSRKDQSGKAVQVQIKREARLTALTMASDGLAVAVGDEAGKIFHVLNIDGAESSKLAVQTLHWHAHGVSSLRFVPNSPFLLSGGAESVLVQWHLQKQEKTFISRIGDQIDSIAVSDNFYGLVLGNNTVRVIRSDNNKCVLEHRGVVFAETGHLSSSSNLVLAPTGDSIQFVDFGQEHTKTQLLALRPRNAVSTADSGIQSKAKVTAFAITPDQLSLCTLDELFDERTQIRVVTLKFWNRTSNDFSEFRLEQVTHLHGTGDCLGHSIETISNDSFAVTLGNDEVKIWSQVKLQEGDKLVWSVVSALKFRDFRVKQLIGGVRLRLSNTNSSSGDRGTEMTLAMLHENGWVSFWAQNGWQFAYSFKLNSAATKIVFEKSSRYLAALSETGQVDVWRLKGVDAKYEWGLQFKSVSEIAASSTIENQFFIKMSSTDEG